MRGLALSFRGAERHKGGDDGNVCVHISFLADRIDEVVTGRDAVQKSVQRYHRRILDYDGLRPGAQIVRHQIIETGFVAALLSIRRRRDAGNDCVVATICAGFLLQRVGTEFRRRRDQTNSIAWTDAGFKAIERQIPPCTGLKNFDIDFLDQNWDSPLHHAVSKQKEVKTRIGLN